jgi:tRNA(Arg) A34 adenosine deaminase TadA
MSLLGHFGVENEVVATHAEINALVGLDTSGDYYEHVLYTTLEPCLLCVGASLRSTIGSVRCAGADPFGSEALPEIWDLLRVA